MNISNIEKFVEDRNRFNSLFGGKALSLLNPQDRREIAERLECELSPENLTCDGELTMAQVRSKSNYLRRCVEELHSIDPSLAMYGV